MAKVDKATIEVPVATIAAAIVKKLTEDGSIVEVVRCGNCAYWDESCAVNMMIDDPGWCEFYEITTPRWGYCHEGAERKEGEDNVETD